MMFDLKKSFVALAGIFLLAMQGHAAATVGLEKGSSVPLYDCVRKLHDAGGQIPFGYEFDFLKDDLFYILDERAPALYLFTPYFAGDAHLDHNMQIAVQRTLAATHFHEDVFPVTPCCQGGFSYDVRIPYVSADPAKSGYFYVNITDPTPAIYDETYFGSDHKMHSRRHNEPIMKVGPHNARINGINRFLAGAPQTTPDFTHYQPEPVENGITVTSVTGQPDKGVTYDSLDVEDKLWNGSALPDLAPEARDILGIYINNGLATLPPVHKVGQQADCWGHAGCDYTYDADWVAREQAAHDAAVQACSAKMNYAPGK